MNITKKMIITDTNIITDLNNAKVLEQFVELDNVYISDLVKYDEVNVDTGDTNIINNFKVINATAEQLLEISSIRLERSKLSTYDALNYIISRDNNGILATGDNELRTFSLENGIEVIRTLKIIELMVENNIIGHQEAIKACRLLKTNTTTRIPIEAIENLVDKFEKDSVLLS